MEHQLQQIAAGLPMPLLLLGIAFALAALGKAADVLVEEAVTLSLRWGVPTAIVGATIVSLGTTTPEAAVSVLAAVQGSPGLALGNAVGSIICDTGLILGIAILISPLKLDPHIVNRQGWLQLGAGVLLVAAIVPGGRLTQTMGFVFLALLAGYLWLSMQWAKSGMHVEDDIDTDDKASTGMALFKLFLALVGVLVSSHVLIPGVREAALRAAVPESVIAATLVAFGTSLPELVTAVTAARKGHGELAVGNVIGADILNVLFVAGAAAAVTPEGLEANSAFTHVLLPLMLGILVIFRIGVWKSGKRMERTFGFILLACYVAAATMSYLSAGF